MSPAPEKLVSKLLAEGLITSEEAEMSKLVPMAHDITVEADSGGHTDNRPLVSLVPFMISARDTIMASHPYEKAIRIGAAGGISTPLSALSAYMMGADYVVSGSINQSCVEAGTSEKTKRPCLWLLWLMLRWPLQQICLNQVARYRFLKRQQCFLWSPKIFMIYIQSMKA